MRQHFDPPRAIRRSMTSPRAVIRKASGDDLLTEIEAMAKKMEPAFAKAILSYLEALKGAVDLQAIADALKTGDVGKVIELLAAAEVAASKAAVTAAAQDTVWAAGAATAASMAFAPTQVTFAFDRLNPRLVTWLQTYTLGLIRQINDQTKEAIREQLVSGMIAGSNPIDTARDIKGVIGLTKRQANAVHAYRKELETFHLKTSAKGYGLGQKIDRVNGRQVFRPDDDGTPMDGIDLRRLRDFRYDSQLQRAMTTGKPIPHEKIDKMVAAYQRKYLRYRSEVIARTETLRATNFGVQDAWRQAIEEGKVQENLVRRKWVVAKDERTCAVCAPIPKMNPPKGVTFSQPFATPKGPVMLPPVHPNCRCTIFVRPYEPEQLGGQ